MRTFSFSCFLMVLALSGSAQIVARPALPFQQGISVSGGLCVLFNEKEVNASNGRPDVGIDLSFNLYKGVGVMTGVRPAHFLSPDILEGYDSRKIIFDGYDKVYNSFKAVYVQLYYDFYLPLTHEPSFLMGLNLKPGLGLAHMRVDEAQFTPHISIRTTGPGMGGFLAFEEQTHDVSMKGTSVSGMAAQLSSYGYVAVSPKCVFYMGPRFWTLPGTHKRYLGMDIQMGLTYGMPAGKR